MSGGEYDYDIAISFAGENRSVVQQFVQLLRDAGLKIFYDTWEQANLWGRDLYQHLHEVYSKKARFCVVFLSAHYAAKLWTNHELKSAQARAFKENKEYILPVRLDDTAIPGIRETVGYLDLRQLKIEQVAEMAIQKTLTAKGAAASPEAAKVAPAPTSAPPRVGKLVVRKKFTQEDRDEYLDEAFETIASYFKDTLAGLPSQSPGFSGKFKRVNTNHFTAMIYLGGENVAQCGVRLGGGVFNNQIVFSEDPDSTNSMNEGVSVADDGEQMFLKAIGMSSMIRPQKKDRLEPHDAAELFWGVLTWRLQQ